MAIAQQHDIRAEILIRMILDPQLNCKVQYSVVDQYWSEQKSDELNI